MSALAILGHLASQATAEAVARVKVAARVLWWGSALPSDLPSAPGPVAPPTGPGAGREVRRHLPDLAHGDGPPDEDVCGFCGQLPCEEWSACPGVRSAPVASPTLEHLDEALRG